LTFGTQFKPKESEPPIFTIFAGMLNVNDSKTIVMNGIRCADPSSCYEDVEGDIDPIPQLWSLQTTWSNYGTTKPTNN